MKRSIYWATGVLLAAAVPSWAGDGVVALQNADPSCGDDSANIYVDCGNGTVTDNRTGLVWVKNANCYNAVNWNTAMGNVAGLADLTGFSSSDCDLSDGSSPGEWRLPSVTEFNDMMADAAALGCVSSGFGGPSITNDSGTSCWQEGPGNSFTGVEREPYWSATTGGPLSLGPGQGLVGDLDLGQQDIWPKSNLYWVWPVRGGQ